MRPVTACRSSMSQHVTPPCCGAGARSALGDDREEEEAESDEEHGREAAHAAASALFGGGLCGIGLGQVEGFICGLLFRRAGACGKAGGVGRVARRLCLSGMVSSGGTTGEVLQIKSNT